jgi:hypothetical protein
VRAKALDILGGPAVPAYTGRRGGVDLHGKLIELPNLVIAGSINLTAQSLGIGSNRAINTESVVTLRRPRGFSLARLLHGFPRVRSDAIAGDGPPGDVDPREDEPDWIEARRLAIVGPTDVRLVLTHGKAGIALVGALGATTRVEVRSQTGGAEAKPLRRLFGRLVDQPELARILGDDEVDVIAFVGKRRLWRRQLDLGNLWSWFEHHGRRSPEDDGAAEGSVTDRKTQRAVAWEDVRVLRRRAFASRRLTAEAQCWDDWWARHGGGQVQGMPAWCIQLGEQLRLLRGHHG